MNTIYLVVQKETSKGVIPILATPNRDLAEAKVAAMEFRKEVRSTIYNRICKHMAEWEMSKIPRPVYVIADDRTLTKAFEEWALKRRTEQLRFTAATFTQAEQDDLRDLNDNLFWEIETVPYEE